MDKKKLTQIRELLWKVFICKSERKSTNGKNTQREAEILVRLNPMIREFNGINAKKIKIVNLTDSVETTAKVVEIVDEYLKSN